MKKIDLKCPSCGGIMKISEDKTEAVCPFCKYKFLIQKEKTLDELKAQEEAISYAREKGVRQAQAEALKKEKKNDRKIFFITILGIAILSGLAAAINYYGKEYMPDPFKCINVKFLGESGRGEAKIESNGNCKESKDIDYSTTKATNLKEGDEIYVDVSSSKYRFDTDRKKYIVKGLSNYVKEINELTDEIKEKIHKLSYNKLKEEIDKDYKYGGKMVSLTQYKLYLHTDNETTNAIYDIYKLKSKTPTGKTYELLVMTKLENVIILKNSTDLFSYTRISQKGEAIDLGSNMLNSSSSMSKDYIGFTYGFKNIDELRNYINSSNENVSGKMVIKE